MRILALDLATKLGWACGSTEGTPVSHGIVQLPRTGDDIGQFLHAYREWLGAAIEELAPAGIVFESPVMNGAHTALATARKLYCLAGITELIALDYRIRICEENLTTIRKHFIGTSRAPTDIKKSEKRRQWLKAKTVAKCRELGFKVAGDDDADAIALLDYILSLKNPKYALNSTPLFRETAA